MADEEQQRTPAMARTQTARNARKGVNDDASLARETLELGLSRLPGTRHVLGTTIFVGHRAGSGGPADVVDRSPLEQTPRADRARLHAHDGLVLVLEDEQWKRGDLVTDTARTPRLDPPAERDEGPLERPRNLVRDRKREGPPVGLVDRTNVE